MADDVKYVPGGDNKELKSALWDHWDSECCWCKRPLVFRDATIDHIIPKDTSDERLEELRGELELGDSFDLHDPCNLAVLCASCNREKSNTDFTRADRILGKLHKAATLRPKVIRHVKTFRSEKVLAKALLRAKSADFTSDTVKAVMREHGPGLFQAMANASGGDLEFTDFTYVALDHDFANVRAALSRSSRRALVVLEDVANTSLDALLADVVEMIESQLAGVVKSEVESRVVLGGSVYAGEPEFDFLDIGVNSISMYRSDSEFDFEFSGEFSVGASASVAQDDPYDPGTLLSKQADAYIEGGLSFSVEWDVEGHSPSPGEPVLREIVNNVTVY